MAWIPAFAGMAGPFSGPNVAYYIWLNASVAGKVVVEVKSVEKLAEIHKAQLLTYLKLGRWQVGLLMNFNVPVLKEGIKRMVLGLKE